MVGWDTVNNVPDEDETDGRSYISAVSEVLDGQTCDGKAKKNMGEARMVSRERTSSSISSQEKQSTDGPKHQNREEFAF